MPAWRALLTRIRQMLQLANPKLLGSGEPAPEVMETIRKAYRVNVDPTFVSNVSKGFMYQVNKEGKQVRSLVYRLARVVCR